MPTIDNFQRLRELELKVTQPTSSYTTLLSSITSTELRKITFIVWYAHNWRTFAQRMKEWAYVDKELCKLVDRLRERGYRHTLAVELQTMTVGDNPGKYDFTSFLPEFREKGIVAIVDTAQGDRILHSSVHSR